MTRPDDSFASHRQDTLKAGAGLCDPQAVELLDDMLAIREMEEMIVRLRSGGYEPLAGYDYRGPTHVSIGQEGTAVGASSVLRPGDRITCRPQGASAPWSRRTS